MNLLPVIAMPVLADPTEADQTVGAWGFVVVLALVVGTFLLWLNMRKQLRKIDVPDDHVEESGPGDSPADAPAGEADPESGESRPREPGAE
jgi:hypothetical protein